MKTYSGLYPDIYAFENLYRAFEKARRYKRFKKEILEFEYDLEKELFKLKEELQGLTYEPNRPQRLIVYEPSRRGISIPAFRDRIVQQALLQVIEPIFEKSFIFDSYAFRIGKGTHSLLTRFDEFKRKVSPRRFPNSGFILKADIKDYYPSVNHNILIRILKEKIADERVIKLIEKILSISPGDKGIAVGSSVSQLFANIYLNKLDYFIKHNLGKKFYLRYCDDFVVLDRSYKKSVDSWRSIEDFLKVHLKLRLHPQKTKCVRTNQGVDLVGFKVFYFHRLVKRKNHRRFRRNLKLWQEEYGRGSLSASKLGEKIRGWISYASYANSYKLRKGLLSKKFLN